MSGLFYAAADTLPMWAAPAAFIIAGVLILAIVFLWDVTHRD